MLDQLRQIAIFTKTVDHGSFRGAAEELGLSPSVISHHVSQLEEHLGVTLLYRSTRKLALTSDGRKLLEAARDMIRAAEDGLQAITETSQAPAGELRVTAPAVLARSPVVRRIAAFSKAYPNVRLTVDFSDSRKEIIGEGYDLALRMGWLKDSSLISKKLDDIPRCLVASASYLQSKPEPQSPNDLIDWEWLNFTPTRNMQLTFKAPDRPAVTIKPNAQVEVNDAGALYELALHGAGLASVPDYLAIGDVSDGKMVFVLPEWKMENLGLYAVWPPNATRKGLTRLFVDMLSVDATDDD